MKKIFALLVMSALGSSAFSMDDPEGWKEKEKSHGEPAEKAREKPPVKSVSRRLEHSPPPLSRSSMPREREERKERKEEKRSTTTRFEDSSPPPPSRSSYAPSPSPYPVPAYGYGTGYPPSPSPYHATSPAYPAPYGEPRGYAASSMGDRYYGGSSHPKFYEEREGVFDEELQNILASLQRAHQIISNPEAAAMTERYIAGLGRGYRDGIWGRPPSARAPIETPKVVHSEDETAQSILRLSNEVLGEYISKLDESGLEELAQDVLNELEKVSGEEQDSFRARFMPLVEKRLAELSSGD